MALVPSAGTNTQITTGGQAVQAAPPGIAGGYIVNPMSATDQGLSAAEPLAVDVVGQCVMVQGNGTIVLLWPGEKFDLPANSTNPVYVNANSSGHKFTVVVFTGS